MIKKLYPILFLFLIINMTVITNAKAQIQKCMFYPPVPKGEILFAIGYDNAIPGKYDTPDAANFYGGLTNKSDLTLSFPLQWIQTKGVMIHFVNIKNPKLQSSTTGVPQADEVDFTKTENDTTAGFFLKDLGNAIRQVTQNKPAEILATVTMKFPVYFVGSPKPIGVYKNGIYEPTYYTCTKQFHLKFGIKRPKQN